MATRSNIGIINENGTVEVIYCHWDGSPSTNGKILLEHYTTNEKVRELINLGAISTLQKNPGKPPEGHSRKTPKDDYVIAYHRDWGETLEPAAVYEDVTMVASECFVDNDVEYLYLFCSIQRKWFVYDVSGDCQILGDLLKI